MNTGGSLALGRDSIKDSNARVRALHSSEGRESIDVTKFDTAASSIIFPCSSCVFIAEDDFRTTDRDLERARALAGEGDRVARPLYMLVFVLNWFDIRVDMRGR